jgi:formamidopyrimidine-DNA glycosylase
MPELPEVETVRRGLQDHVVGRRIESVTVLWDKTIETPSAAGYVAALAGRAILAAARRGKYLVLSLDNDQYMTIHLRMTGRLFLLPAGAAARAHTRIVWSLSDGNDVHFVDPRKFGRVALLDPAGLQRLHDRLGPEPFDIGVEDLARRLARRSPAIKTILLDQSVLAGVGNIYADEALHAAAVSPQRPARSLSDDEVRRLRAAVRDVLLSAVERHGTTLSDEQFRGLEGHIGENQGYLAVFRRTGQPCPRCGAAIQRTRLGGRSTHFCATCQR